MPPSPLRVGLTTYDLSVPWGDVHKQVALTPMPYVAMAQRSGGLALLIPPAPPEAVVDHWAASTLDLLDALVVIGGNDVDPTLYGQAAHERTHATAPGRDEAELALLRGAIERDLPVLAICRGHQLLNVALGGTLHQHLPDLLGHEDHQIGSGRYSPRRVRTVPGTRTAALHGAELVVSCSHHQGIDQLGDGLKVTAWSVEDDGGNGVIEAVELEGARFCLGVQWHPEDQADERPFLALVDAVAAARRR